MENKKYHPGLKMKHLTLIEEIPWKPHVTKWICKCDCGNTCTISRGNLSKGTQSCGCMKAYKDPNQSGKNRLFWAYRQNAKLRKLKFSLNIKQFLDITSQNCFYCGAPPSNSSKSWTRNKKYKGTYIYSGIDRVDNTKGYVKGNVVPCCKQCNLGKRDVSKKEFLDWALRICTHNNLIY